LKKLIENSDPTRGQQKRVENKSVRGTDKKGDREAAGSANQVLKREKPTTKHTGEDEKKKRMSLKKPEFNIKKR